MEIAERVDWIRGPTDQALARLKLRRKVGCSVPSFLLIPEILQMDGLVALVPSRLLRENNKGLVVLKPPVVVPVSTSSPSGIPGSIRILPIAGCGVVYWKLRRAGRVESALALTPGQPLVVVQYGAIALRGWAEATGNHLLNNAFAKR
jgi:hypothetical protein